MLMDNGHNGVSFTEIKAFISSVHTQTTNIQLLARPDRGGESEATMILQQGFLAKPRQTDMHVQIIKLRLTLFYDMLLI